MTIQDTPRRAGPFNGNGIATSFPFVFKIFDATELAVYFINSSGTSTLITTNYSVALNPNQDTNPGGTVTYPISGSPLATGNQLVLIGNAPYEQETVISNSGNFPPAIVESSLDYATILIQQLKEEDGRTLKVGVGDNVPLADLPSPSGRIDKILAFDSINGINPVVTYFTASQVANAISAAYSGGTTLDAISYLPSGPNGVTWSAQTKLQKQYIDITDMMTTAQRNDYYSNQCTLDLTAPIQYALDEAHRTQINSIRIPGGGSARVKNVKMYCGQHLWGDWITPYGRGITSDTSGVYGPNSFTSRLVQDDAATGPLIAFYPVKETVYDRIYGVSISNFEIVMSSSATGTYDAIRFQDPAFDPTITESAQPRQTLLSSNIYLHDLFIRDSKGHGIWMPACHGGVVLERINSFFNAKAGIFIDAYAGMEGLALYDIDGDANLLGNIRIYNMGRTGGIGASYTSYSNISIQNARGEQRTNPNYNIAGDFVGTKNVIVLDTCNRGKVNIHGLTHLSSVTGDAPNISILITGQTSGYTPTITADGVIAMVELAQAGDTAPLLLSDTVNSITIPNLTSTFSYGADPGVSYTSIGVSATTTAGPQNLLGRSTIRGWTSKSSAATQVAGIFPFSSVSAETAPTDCKVWGFSADSTGQAVFRAQKDDGSAADPIVSFIRSAYNDTGINVQKLTNFVSGLSTSNSAWNFNVLKLGIYYLWIDTSGRLRIKNAAPTSDTDGTVVGTQT